MEPTPEACSSDSKNTCLPAGVKHEYECNGVPGKQAASVVGLKTAANKQRVDVKGDVEVIDNTVQIKEQNC